MPLVILFIRNSDMTTLIKHHPFTNEIALFETSGQYWIGEYCPFLSHQNSEQDYLLVADCDNLEDGINKLMNMEQ